MKEAISIVSNMWIKRMYFEYAGDMMEGHKHTFDHQTLLSYGKFKVCVEGECTIYDADESYGLVLFIEKGKDHSIECISDKGLGYCLHPIRDGERVEDIIDPAQMPMMSGSMLDKMRLVE